MKPLQLAGCKALKFVGLECARMSKWSKGNRLKYDKSMQSCAKSGYENENTNKERQAMPLLKNGINTACLIKGQM